MGIVRIEIVKPTDPEDMAERLAAVLTLKHVAVAETGRDRSALTTLAEPASRLLKQVGLGHGKVLAVGWGRTIWQLLEVGLPQIAGTLTVPAIGGMPEPAPQFQINEFVRQAASQLTGMPRFIHAPYLLSDQSRRSLLADPAIRESILLWDRLDAALVGIGVPHSSGLNQGSFGVTPTDPAINKAAGDVLLRYFDIEGRLIEWTGQNRLLAISPRPAQAYAYGDWGRGVTCEGARHHRSSAERCHRRARYRPHDGFSDFRIAQLTTAAFHRELNTEATEGRCTMR